MHLIPQMTVLHFNKRTFSQFSSLIILSVLISVYQCPKDDVLSGASGSFTSPGFPLSYPNDVTCSWIIEVPENHFVQLTFETFEVNTCTIAPSLCLCDHVEVRDGKTASSPELEKLCGDKTLSSLYSSGRYMWVEFKSGSGTAQKGFNATFEAGKMRNIYLPDVT